MTATANETCTCGAVVPTVDGTTHPYMLSTAGCWSLYSQILAREYGDPRYFAVHRFTVDCYAAQHPGRPERKAIQSVNAHLVGLHVMLERGSSAGFAGRTIGVVADSLSNELKWLDPPDTFGRLTVEDVVGASDAEAHCAVVRDWAAEVWAAWSLHHETIRILASRAMEKI
jgi:Family of unknown function (DUF5946)